MSARCGYRAARITTGQVTVALSHYLPGGGAALSRIAVETIYIVLAGEIVMSSAGDSATLGVYDTVRLPARSERAVENVSNLPATILVITPAL